MQFLRFKINNVSHNERALFASGPDRIARRLSIFRLKIFQKPRQNQPTRERAFQSTSWCLSENFSSKHYREKVKLFQRKWNWIPEPTLFARCKSIEKKLPRNSARLIRCRVKGQKIKQKWNQNFCCCCVHRSSSNFLRFYSNGTPEKERIFELLLVFDPGKVFFFSRSSPCHHHPTIEGPYRFLAQISINEKLRRRRKFSTGLDGSNYFLVLGTLQHIFAFLLRAQEIEILVGVPFRIVSQKGYHSTSLCVV